MTWSIKVALPELDVALTHVRITDTLDPRLRYSVHMVHTTGGTPVTLVEPADYTFALTGTDPGPQHVDVQLTSAGIAKMRANGAETVSLALGTTVRATDAEPTIGTIPNQATVYINDPNSGVHTGTVTSKWGTLTIRKIDEKTPSQALEGAEFAIYASPQDMAANAPVATGTSGADGLVHFTRLRYSGWVNGETVDSSSPLYRTYLLVERKAPAGYSLLAEPIDVIIDSADTVVDLEVANTPSNAGFAMPFSGGPGQAAGGFLGVGIIAVGVWGFARSRKWGRKAP